MVCLVDDMQQKWDNSFGSDHVSRNVRDAVIKQYASSGLAYHNLEHIYWCLQLLEQYKDLATRKTELAYALWFHDIVYDPKSKDNEEKSVALAQKHAAHMRTMNSIFLAGVRDLIMATKHTGTIVSFDCALIVDIDLAILGASREGYDRYARAIRQEFSFVESEDFNIGRAKVMQGFLDRKRIYHTPDFQDRFEHRARENIAREIKRLKK